MPSVCRGPELLAPLLALPQSGRSHSFPIAGIATPGAVRLEPSVLRRELMAMHAVSDRHDGVSGAILRSRLPLTLHLAGFADPAVRILTRVLRRVLVTPATVRSGPSWRPRRVEVVVPEPGARQAVPSSSVHAGVLCGERMTVRALRSAAVPIGSPALRRVFRVEFDLHVGRIHATAMRAIIPSVARSRLVAHMVDDQASRYLADQYAVRDSVGIGNISLVGEPSVALPSGGSPSPAAVGVDAHLVPEALGQSGVAVSRRGGTFGHVRLLRSRTVPRECSNTRRGPSCHFTEFPSYRREEFLVHSGAERHRPGMHLANSASKQGENP
jgi:hypothetical protein